MPRPATIPGTVPATVSVVVPCFNQAAFVAAAIHSVRAQEDVPVEIVAVDDGSTDETPAILAAIPEVRILRRPHAGVSAARNAGLQAARGRYLVFLDADDRLLPGALAANLQVLEQDPACAFVAGSHVRTDAAGQQLAGGPPPVATTAVYERLLRGNCVHTAAVMYRREPLEEVGGFDPRLEVCEDWALYLRLARRLPARLHERVVSEYRRHGGQATARRIEDLLRSGLSLLRRQRPLLEGERERAAWRAGLRFWREFYGCQLQVLLRGDLRGRRFLRAARRAAVLARHAPGYVARAAARRLLRLGGRPAREALAPSDGGA